MLDKTILQEGKRVFRKVSRKDGIVYGVAHRRRKNKAPPYNGGKVLEAYERNLADYHQATDEAARSFKPARHHK